METYDDLIRRARTALGMDDHSTAITLFTRASDLRPLAPMDWVQLAISYAERGELDLALDACERAVRSNPAKGLESAAVYGQLASTLLDLQRLSEAEEAFRRRLREDPLGTPEASGHILFGVCLGRQGRLDEAEECYRRALEIAPSNEEGMFNLAMVLPKERVEERIDLLRQAIQIDPQYAIAYRELGILLAEQSKLSEAESLLTKSLTLERDDARAHEYLALVLDSQGRHKAAAAERARASETKVKDSSQS